MYILASNFGDMPGSTTRNTSDPYKTIQNIRDDIEENAEYGLSDVDYIDYWMKHGLFDVFFEALSKALKSDFGIECYQVTAKKIEYKLLDDPEGLSTYYDEVYDSIFNLKGDYTWLLIRTQDLDPRGLVEVESKNIRAKFRTSYEDHGKTRSSNNRWKDVVEDGRTLIDKDLDEAEVRYYLEESFDGTLDSYMKMIRDEVAYKRDHPYAYFYCFTNPQGMNLSFNVVSRQEVIEMINDALQSIQLDVSDIGQYIGILSDDGQDVGSYVPINFKFVASKFLFNALKYEDTRTAMKIFEDQLIKKYVNR